MLFRPEFKDGKHDQRILNGKHGSQATVTAPQLLAHEAVRRRVSLPTAITLNVNTEQMHLRHARYQFYRESCFVKKFGDDRHTLHIHKFTDSVPNLFFFLGQQGIRPIKVYSVGFFHNEAPMITNSSLKFCHLCNQVRSALKTS